MIDKAWILVVFIVIIALLWLGAGMRIRRDRRLKKLAGADRRKKYRPGRDRRWKPRN